MLVSLSQFIHHTHIFILSQCPNESKASNSGGDTGVLLGIGLFHPGNTLEGLLEQVQ